MSEMPLIISAATMLAVAAWALHLSYRFASETKGKSLNQLKAEEADLRRRIFELKQAQRTGSAKASRGHPDFQRPAAE